MKTRINSPRKTCVRLIGLALFAVVITCSVRGGQSSSPLVSLRLEPFVIRTGPETCRLIAQADPDIRSIRLENSFILYRGTLNTNLPLFDDGTHGDSTAGDHFFTSDQISFDLANDPFSAGQPLLTASYTIPNATFTCVNGRTEALTVNHPLTVRLIRNEYYAKPPATRLGMDAQKSDYCLNLVITATPTNNYDFDVGAVVGRYYGLLPDDRDFLMIEDAFQRSALGLAGYYVSVSNKDQGFGVGVFDYSASLGSSGKLQGYVRTLSSLNPGLLNHELLHRWAAFLDGLSSGSHWRAILRPSSGFGPFWGAYKEFRLVSGRTYRAVFDSTGFVYSDLELYLMGLVESTSVAWPIKYLINAIPLSAGFDPVTQTSYHDFDTDGIGEVSLAQVIAQYGERTPPPPAAQTRFKLGTIVVYDRLLSEVELAYYDMFAREYGRPSTSWSNFTAFGSATGGRAEMSTLLPTCVAGIRLERLGHGQVLVSWPLPECGHVLHHTTTFGRWDLLPPPYQTNADHLSAVRSEQAEFFQLRPLARQVADYAFEGTALDSKGNSPPMELRNTTFTNGTLCLNGIYEFDNPQGFHALARIFGFSYESFTVALDFFATDFSDNNILTGGSSYRWFSLRHNAGGLEVTLNNQALVYLIPDSQLKTNEWQTVICSVDASAKRIITVLNGQRLQDIPLSPDFRFEVIGSPVENTDRLFTFADYGDGSVFHGYVDNLKVWNRALTSSEIAGLR